MGHEVHFLYIEAEGSGDREGMRAYWGDRFRSVPYAAPKAKAGLTDRVRRFFRKTTYSIDDWYDPSLDKVLADLTRNARFDIVMVEYVFFSKALQYFNQPTLRIIDTHDVFSNRHQRMTQHGLELNWYSTVPAEEARGLNRADVVIAISPEDQEHLARLTSRQVITISHIVSLSTPVPYQPSQTGKMLFVGSANPMNVQAVCFFMEEIYPSIRKVHPFAQLLVVGTVCDLLPGHLDCVNLGKQDDLRSIYAAVDVVVNPMRFGTGLSIKSLEALAYGKPLVTTSAGARGLSEGTGKAFLVADAPEEFASAVVNVLCDPGLSKTLSQNAYDFAVRWNERNLAALNDLLNA